MSVAVTAAAAINQRQPAKASPLEIFRERCEAKCLLIANGYENFQSAVDELWHAAERAGLVDELGADAVQLVLAESFARWQYE